MEEQGELWIMNEDEDSTKSQPGCIKNPVPDCTDLWNCCNAR